MSATNRGGERVALDAYYTPDDVARLCVSALPDAALPRDGEWALEPSVGGGAFVRALQARQPGAQVVGIDLDPAAPGLTLGLDALVGDFTRVDLSAFPPPRLVYGNPPYREAEEHIRHALHVVRPDGPYPAGYVAFLLRLAMLESERRRPLWRDHPPIAVHVLARRPSFTGGGTDSAAYAWFVWRRGYSGVPSLGWL